MSSSAFHPATIGALYGVLAKHEQALAQWSLAETLAQGSVDSETADRYAVVVEDVKRLIAMTEPRPIGTSAIEGSERMQRAIKLLGVVQSQVPEFDIWSWHVSDDEISGNLRDADDGNDAVRANMHVIADRLGIEYVEKRHGRDGTTLIVCAKGKIDGFDVRIYDLIQAERPICDTHHVMVDEARVCSECASESVDDQVDPDIHALMPDGTETPRCGAPYGSRISMIFADVTCPECASHLAGEHAEEDSSELSADPDEPDDASEGRFTDTQLDGTACSACGEDFAEGVAAVPTGLVIDGGQLFAHPDCLTDTTTTEPPGDAP